MAILSVESRCARLYKSIVLESMRLQSSGFLDIGVLGNRYGHHNAEILRRACCVFTCIKLLCCEAKLIVKFNSFGYL